MSGMFNRGMYVLTDGATPWTSSDFRALLVTSSFSFDPDLNTVSQITNELSGGGYARVALSSKTRTEDDSLNRVVFDAADATFAALGLAAGTPARVIVYKYNASDASAELISCHDLTSPPAPNGGDYTIVWASSGLFYLSSP